MNPYFDNIIKKNDKDIDQIKKIILSIIEKHKVYNLNDLSVKLNESKGFFSEKIITEVGSSEWDIKGSNNSQLLIFYVNESLTEDDFLFDYRFHEIILFDIDFSDLEIKPVEARLLTDFGYVTLNEKILSYNLNDKKSSSIYSSAVYHEVMVFIMEKNIIKDEFYEFSSEIRNLSLGFVEDSALIKTLEALSSVSVFEPRLVLDFLFNDIKIKKERIELFQLENDINIDLSHPNLKKIQFDTNKVKLNFNLKQKKNSKVNIIK